MKPRAPAEDSVVESIRANIVFEKMIVAVLTVAAVSGAAHLLASVAASGLSPSAIGLALLSAATFTLLFFFTAFAGAVAVGVPLFLQLEKRKVRAAWPYAVAAFLVSLAVLAAAGMAPGFEAPWRAAYLVPGVAAALLFARKMRPFWRAAERAEQASAAAIVRLH